MQACRSGVQGWKLGHAPLSMGCPAGARCCAAALAAGSGAGARLCMRAGGKCLVRQGYPTARPRMNRMPR